MTQSVNVSSLVIVQALLPAGYTVMSEKGGDFFIRGSDGMYAVFVYVDNEAGAVFEFWTDKYGEAFRAAVLQKYFNCK
jgi:hypothetical protein